MKSTLQIHPDIFYADGYQERQDKDEAQKQLSKEFVREWLMAGGFQGKDGQNIPEMTPEFVNSVTDRYVELFEKVSGESFSKDVSEDPLQRIENNVSSFLSKHYK